MMKITATDRNAIVSVTRNEVESECCAQHKCGDTLSPLPSLESLSISTETTDDMCSSSSSSVSSQDSSNFVASGNSSRAPPKRSFFSQYWQKTGQTPVVLRPVKPLSTTELPNKITNLDASTSESESMTSESLPYPIDRSIASMSNADFLEDHDEEDEGSESSALDEPSCREEYAARESSQTRRRSILPPAPVSQPALRSWKKSASLSNFETYSGYNNSYMVAKKSRSLPRMRSTSAIQPGPSCLRPFQKYSPTKTNTPNSPIPHTSRRLLRSDSSSSSVSFQEAVDVRHFEPPRESFAEKGWSEYFN